MKKIIAIAAVLLALVVGLFILDSKDKEERLWDLVKRYHELNIRLDYVERMLRIKND